MKKGSVVQLDRISDFGSEGWGFESSLGHFLSLNKIKTLHILLICKVLTFLNYHLIWFDLTFFGL